MTGECVLTVGSREVSERVARCVATMVFFQGDRQSWAGVQLMREETRSLLDWAAQSGSRERLAEFILKPLERELSDRFGLKDGHRLQQEFLRSLRDSSKR